MPTPILQAEAVPHQGTTTIIHNGDTFIWEPSLQEYVCRTPKHTKTLYFFRGKLKAA